MQLTIQYKNLYKKAQEEWGTQSKDDCQGESCQSRYYSVLASCRPNIGSYARCDSKTINSTWKISFPLGWWWFNLQRLARKSLLIFLQRMQHAYTWSCQVNLFSQVAPVDEYHNYRLTLGSIMHCDRQGEYYRDWWIWSKYVNWNCRDSSILNQSKKMVKRTKSKLFEMLCGCDISWRFRLHLLWELWYGGKWFIFNRENRNKNFQKVVALVDQSWNTDGACSSPSCPSEQQWNTCHRQWWWKNIQRDFLGQEQLHDVF